MTDQKIFIEVLRCMFLALGQAMGPKVIVNASALLAQLASKSDPKVQEMLEQILAAVDGSTA
jgi:hypothetical protein